MKKLWYICTVKYYLAINGVQCHGCTSCSARNTDTKEMHTVWFYWLKVQEKAKQYIVVESKIVVTWYGLQRERNFWGDDQTQYHDLGSKLHKYIWPLLKLFGLRPCLHPWKLLWIPKILFANISYIHQYLWYWLKCKFFKYKNFKIIINSLHVNVYNTLFIQNNYIF